ncbi:MAG: alkylmercury lyase family protein [Bryobacteraceae bacterium]|jgi:hypothetical protein
MKPERLHYLLTRYVIAHGHAPDSAQLSEICGCTQRKAEDLLRRMAEMHGVILEPGSVRIWSLHPFALMPAAFWVSAGGRGWWANCAWCSLGIGAALEADIAVSTRDGAEGDPVDFEIRGGASTRPELLMHFPYPPARWWDNPYCPCGNILFFAGESKVEEWCARHGRPKGALLDMRKAIGLADRWFGDYASPEWRRKTPEQALGIFAELELDPEFWTLPDGFR